MNDLDKKLQDYLSNTDEQLTPEQVQEIREKFKQEINEKTSGWTENTVGFSLNEIRRD